LDFVSILRLSTVFCAYAAAAFALSHAGAAQEFKEISLAVGQASGNGYMALGGGLEKALIDEEPLETEAISKTETEPPVAEKPEAKKAESKKTAEKPDSKKGAKSATDSHRHEHPRAATRSAPRRLANITPTALVARTLDHTGMNIGLLRVQTPAP
jgi:hypothetical protein